MITRQELKTLQSFIAFTLDADELRELHDEGGDNLVFIETQGMIENDMNDTNATGLAGFVYKDLLATISKVGLG